MFEIFSLFQSGKNLKPVICLRIILNSIWKENS